MELRKKKGAFPGRNDLVACGLFSGIGLSQGFGHRIFDTLVSKPFPLPHPPTKAVGSSWLEKQEVESHPLHWYLHCWSGT